MKRLLFAAYLILLFIPATAHAQLWSGILQPTSGVGACTLLGTTSAPKCAIDWTGAGVGGTPWTSYTQLGSTITSTGGDQTGQIQTALNSCNGTSKYVLLATGTFNVTNLTIPDHCELRGNGANLTVLNPTGGGGGAVIALGSSSAFPSGSGVSVTSGALAGSTSITLSSTSGISAGMYLVINELNYSPSYPSIYVNLSGGPGGGNCTFCFAVYGQTFNNGEARARAQIVEVQGVSGTVVTISPSLYTDYTHTLPNWQANTVYPYAAVITNGGTSYLMSANNGSPYTCTSGGGSFTPSGDGSCNWTNIGSGTTTAPLATAFAASAKDSGVANLQIHANNTGYGENFIAQECAYCWIRGVEGNFADGDHVDLFADYRNEVIDSYFSNSFLHTAGTHDSDIELGNGTSDSLVQNDILERLHVGVLLETGAAGNVIGYNYLKDNFDQFSTNFTIEGTDAHAAHTQFNLFEGNVEPTFILDSTWGSHSHWTTFRNQEIGTNKICSPFSGTRSPAVNCTPSGTPGSSNGYYSFQANRMESFDFEDPDSNSIGNVFGSTQATNIGSGSSPLVNTSNTPLSQSASILWPASRSYDAVVYGQSFGYSGASDGGSFQSNSTLAGLTTLNHGNYNAISNTITWSGAITHTLPASMYLTATPSWWDGSAFPCIGPDVTGGSGIAGHVCSSTAGNPAQNCYLNVMGGSDGGAGSPLTFNAYSMTGCNYGSGGGGGTPAISFSPANFNFGSVAVGGIIPACPTNCTTITLSNPGTGTLTWTGFITMGGTNPGDFTFISNSCPSPGVLGAGSSCAMVVQFAPTTNGSRSAAIMVSGTNISGMSYTVPLNGNGVSVVPNVPTAPILVGQILEAHQ